MPEFSVLDYLALQVETDPVGLVNLVQNPSGELGGYGWRTPVPGSYLEATDDGERELHYLSAASTSNYVTTENVPVTAGSYVAASWHMVAGSGAYRVNFVWVDSTGANLGSSAVTTFNFPVTNTDAATPAYQAPTGTVACRLVLEFGTNSNTFPLIQDGFGWSFNKVAVSTSTLASDLATVRTNRITNPSFTLDTTGWSAGGGALDRATGTDPYGRVSASAAGNVMSAWTAPIAVAQGAPFLARADIRTIGMLPAGRDGVFVSIAWTDSNGNSLGTSRADYPITADNTFQPIGINAVAPVGAAHAVVKYGCASGAPNTSARLNLDHALFESNGAPWDTVTYFDGSTTAGGGWTYTWNGTANASSSKAVLSRLAYTDPVQYTDILGDSGQITITREELNVGTIAANVAGILDPATDPATSPALRPGRKLRLVVTPPDSDVPEPLFTGAVSNAHADYDPLAPTVELRTRVTLSGVDDTQLLANVKRASTVTKIADLPFILEGAGVPWDCDGQSSQVATAAVAATDPNASALDQVAIVRDSVGGYAWIDRAGVLQAATTLPSTSGEVIGAAGQFTATGTTPSGSFGANWFAVHATMTSHQTPPAGLTGYTGYAGKITADGTGPLLDLACYSGLSAYTIPVTAGKAYTLAWSARAGSTARRSTCAIIWRDSAGNQISKSGAADLTDYLQVTSTAWTTRTRDVVAPVGAVEAEIVYELVSNDYNAGTGTNLPSGEVHWLANVTLSDQITTRAIDENVYNPGIVVDYDTDRCINTVTVTNRTTVNGQTIETVFGPYTDPTSIAQWGSHAATFTTVGLDTNAKASAYATRVLAANAQPSVTVESITIPINSPDRIPYALIDIYDVLHVTNTELGIDQLLRVTGVTHSIAPGLDFDRWLVTLTFATQDSVATPTAAPVLGGQGTPASPFMNAQRNAAFTIPSGVFTTLGAGWAVNTVGGGDTASLVNGVWTCPTAGYYWLSGTVTFSTTAGTNARRMARIIVNNAELVREEISSPNANASPNVAAGAYLNAGDTVALQAYQNSGSDLSVAATNTTFQAMYIRS